MKKIVFLNPSLDGKYTKLGDITTVLPPVGICQLSSVVRDKYEPKIIDQFALRLDNEETVKRILDEDPAYLGVTSTTMNIFNAVSIADSVKKENPHIKIILGGAHLTTSPIETMQRFSSFDVGVYGEGELTLLELLDKIDKKKNINNVKGLVIKIGKKVFITERRPYISNLDTLPFPAYDLLPDLAKHYQPIADKMYKAPTTIVVTSRGCPGQCIFCEKSIFGNVCRANSAGYVVKLIKYLRDGFGINSLIFDEDNFLVFRRRLKEICEIMIKEKIDMPWSCSGRVDMIDEETLKLMKKAGCWQIIYGAESGSQKILDILHKGTTVEQNEKAIKLTHEAGISVKCSFMFGSFGETLETLEETKRFIMKVPLDDINLCRFSPFPGTKAWELAPKYGSFDPDWEKVNVFQSNNFVPKELTNEQIDVYYKKLYRSFYLRPKIMLYYLKKLRDPLQRKSIMKSGVSFLRYTFKK
ncbi:MAG: radical SAM protein [archaeon]